MAARILGSAAASRLGCCSCGGRRAPTRSTPLIDAVQAGRRGRRPSALQQSADVNAAEADGTTALHWAVRGRTTGSWCACCCAPAPNARARQPLRRHAAAAGGRQRQRRRSPRRCSRRAPIPNAVLPEGETILMTAARTGAAGAAAAAARSRRRPGCARAVVRRDGAASGRRPRTTPTRRRCCVERGARRERAVGAADVSHGAAPASRCCRSGSWTPLMYAARQNALDAGTRARRAKAESRRHRSRWRHRARHRDHQRQLRVRRVAARRRRRPERRGQGRRHGAALRRDRHAPAGDRPRAAEPAAVGHARRGGRRAAAARAEGRSERARSKAAIFQRHHTMGDFSLGKGATPFMRAAKSGDVEVMKLLLGGRRRSRADAAQQVATR